MSEDTWTDVIQREVIEQGNATHCALISDDGSIWAKSKNFSTDPILSQEDCPNDWLQSLLDGFNDPETILSQVILEEDKPPSVSGGFYLLNKHFIVTHVIKDKVICAKNGVMGCFLYKTNQAILIVVYGISNEPGESYLETESFVQYLMNQGL
ncbi:hypothetical protein ABK040_001802 [Willaertia magna]